MKILILNWRDIKHPLAGGAEISLFEHAKFWKSLNNEIIWFSSHYPDAPYKEDIEGISVVRKGSHYTVHVWAFLYSLAHKLPKADIIIDSFHFVPFLSPLYIREKHKVIGLLNEVAGNLWFLNIILPFAYIGYMIEPYLIGLYKKNNFITGSNSAKEDLIRLGIPQKNIVVVHHGFHLHHVPQKIKKEISPTIIFLGRVTRDKGITDALEVFAGINKEIPAARLWIVGKEEKEGTMESLLKPLASKVKKNISYYGFVSENEKFVLLRKAWILLHTSYKEGWGLTVIEAASQGTPTVGYNVEGLRDSVQDGKTGILVEPKNTTLLKEGILHTISDRKYRDMLSENAKKWSKNFAWEKSVRESWQVIMSNYEKSEVK